MLPRQTPTCQNRYVPRRAHSLIIVFTAFVVACGTDPGPGTGDAGADAMETPMGGLRLLFDSVPDIPDSAGGPFDARIDTATIRLRNLRAIGDAAPGDERTRVEDLTLRWTDETQPGAVVFANAPLGLYSQVAAEIVEYTITGSVKIMDVTYPFEIEDNPPPISVVASIDGTMVSAGEVEDVTIKIQIGDVVTDIDWADQEIEDNMIELESDDPDISDVREEMSELFE